jgi:hypothetical protein
MRPLKWFLSLAIPLLLSSPASPAGNFGSFTIYGEAPIPGDVVISYPWGPAIQRYATERPGSAIPARVVAGAEPATCFYITRVSAWYHYRARSSTDYLMVGKFDVKGIPAAWVRASRLC